MLAWSVPRKTFLLYHVRVVSTVVVCCVAMDTGSWKEKRRAGPERVQTPSAGANAASNSTTSDGILPNRFEHGHETGA